MSSSRSPENSVAWTSARERLARLAHVVAHAAEEAAPALLALGLGLRRGQRRPAGDEEVVPVARHGAGRIGHDEVDDGDDRAAVQRAARIGPRRLLGRLRRGPCSTAPAAEVTLRRPPPLATPLEVARRDGGVALLVGDDVVVEARVAALDLDAPGAGRARRGRGRVGALRVAARPPVPHLLRLWAGARPGRRAVPVLRPGRRRPLRDALDARPVDRRRHGGAVVRLGGARLPQRRARASARSARRSCSGGSPWPWRPRSRSAPRT